MHTSLLSSVTGLLLRPVALAVALVAVLSGCTDVLVTPASSPPAGLAVVFQANPSSASGSGPGEAFDRADAVRLRIVRPESEMPTFEATLPLPATGAQRRVGPITLEMRQSREQVEVSLELLRGQDVLFRGSAQSVELRAGQTAEAPVAPVAVPGGVRVPESVADLTSLGDTVQLTGSVTFATGDDIPGLPLTWSTQNPNIVEVSPQGRVISRAEGTAVVVATFEDFSRSVNVRVNPLVVTITLEPAAPRIGVNEVRQLNASLYDARGNVLANRVVESWTSSNEAVVTVDQTGRVTGVSAGTATITARHGTRSGTAEVTVTQAPPPGQDVVVFNDINIFDNSFGFREPLNPGNVQLARNLVVFSTQGSRDAGNVVWFDRGRNSRCMPTDCGDANLSRLRSTITNAGMTIQNITSSSGSITNIPADVKVIFLWNPQVAYTVPEINAFKQFAAEGGRIIFVGEHQGYYGAGIPIQNQFLTSMGAVLRNTGGAVDCNLNVIPTSSIRPHQITEGVPTITMACASVIEPGPQDFPLFYDTTGQRLLAGVARIDIRPIMSVPAVVEVRMQAVDAGVNTNTSSGQ